MPKKETIKKIVSEEYKAYESFIEKYKTQNPLKYELKKEELLKKLNLLK